MEINYDIIIKYLAKNENENENIEGIVKKNLIKKYNDFSEDIQSILKNNFYIYGIKVYNDNNENISHWSSLLFLIIKDFILLTDNEQLIYIKKIKSQMVEYIKTNYKKFKNRKKFSKNYAIELIRSNKFNPLILELFSYCFKINIIIIDFLENKIFTVSVDEYFNPWKPTVFLSKHNDFFQPLLTNTNKKFYYDNLKFIFNNEIEYYSNDFLEQNFVLIDNIFEIINMDENKKKLSDDENDHNSDEINNTFIKNTDFNKNKLNKMKKTEIIELIKQFNLNIKIKQKKSYLINEMINL